MSRLTQTITRASYVRSWFEGYYQGLMNDDSTPSGHFETPQLLQAYERAINENIISSITDAKGTIVYANAKFCETSQYSQSELQGQNHRIVNSRIHSREFFRGMWSTISGGNVWHDEVCNRARDGSLYWVDTVIVPIKDDAGFITHYLSLRTLITTRKALEQAKKNHVDSLEALLVMTSQKVRRPLTLCLHQIDQLDLDHLDHQNIVQVFESLRSSAAEIDRFTRELTTFIRDMEL